jgi:undecaprenyl diphosphate synthase
MAMGVGPSQRAKTGFSDIPMGSLAVRATTEGCAELGVKYLTLYAFSTENWNRPMLEVSGLMNLLLKTIQLEVKTLQKNNIRLRAIGNIDELPGNTARRTPSGNG